MSASCDGTALYAALYSSERVWRIVTFWFLMLYCSGIGRCLTSSRIVSYGIVSCRITSCGMASYGMASYGIASYGIASYGIISYRTTSCKIISCGTTSYEKTFCAYMPPPPCQRNIYVLRSFLLGLRPGL